MKIFDQAALTSVRTLKGHDGRVNEVRFARGGQNNTDLYTASSDGSIKLWDIRQDACSCTFSKGGSECWSADMDFSGTLIACGQGTKIRVWDLRTGKLMCTYDDAHTDDVTQARFQPLPKSKLVTASVDGLICVLDPSQKDLDDALECVLNAEVSVGRIGFAGKSAQQLWCLTHVEGMQIWSLASEQPLVRVDDIRPALAASGPGRDVDYLVGCFYGQDSDQLYLVGGDDDGRAGVWRLGPGGPVSVGPLSDTAGGHCATVRAADWNFSSRKVVIRHVGPRRAALRRCPPRARRAEPTGQRARALPRRLPRGRLLVNRRPAAPGARGLRDMRTSTETGGGEGAREGEIWRRTRGETCSDSLYFSSAPDDESVSVRTAQ